MLEGWHLGIQHSLAISTTCEQSEGQGLRKDSHAKTGMVTIGATPAQWRRRVRGALRLAPRFQAHCTRMSFPCIQGDKLAAPPRLATPNPIQTRN